MFTSLRTEQVVLPSVSIPEIPLTTNTFRGKVIRTSGNSLVMENKAGWEHSLVLSPYAKVSCDGSACLLGELKPGLKIRVTALQSDRGVATCVVAFKKNNEFT